MVRRRVIRLQLISASTVPLAELAGPPFESRTETAGQAVQEATQCRTSFPAITTELEGIVLQTMNGGLHARLSGDVSGPTLGPKLSIRRPSWRWAPLATAPLPRFSGTRTKSLGFEASELSVHDVFGGARGVSGALRSRPQAQTLGSRWLVQSRPRSCV